MQNSIELSKQDFENIFKNVLSPIIPFQKTEEKFNQYTKENNISFDVKFLFNNKEHTYLELYNFAYYNRFNIFN